MAKRKPVAGTLRVPSAGSGTRSVPTTAAADSVPLAMLVQRWETLRARGRKAYSDAGQTLAQIAARMQAGESCTLTDGRSPRLIDKGTPEFWKGRSYTREESYLSRYELSIE